MTTKDQQIREAALELFVENGFSTSTSSITKRAGVSSGILFHYFPTKDDLIRDLFSTAVESQLGPSLIILSDLFSNGTPSREEHERAHRNCWSAIIGWELSHWTEFSYIRQYSASSYARNFGYVDIPKVKELLESLASTTEAGIEAGYLRNLPADFLVQATLDNMELVALYIHDASLTSKDHKLLENGLWESYWSMVSAE